MLLGFILGIIFTITALLLYASCKVAGESDKEIEKMNEKKPNQK